MQSCEPTVALVAVANHDLERDQLPDERRDGVRSQAQQRRGMGDGNPGVAADDPDQLELRAREGEVREGRPDQAPRPATQRDGQLPRRA